jgi:uncharacterized protein YcaQ
VLPFLWRDRIVGRADLKSERSEGSLVVKALQLEAGVRRSRALDEAFDRALDAPTHRRPRVGRAMWIGAADETRHRLQLQAFCKQRASAGT